MTDKQVQNLPRTKKWTWKKPPGKPKRPLSAYNLFFRAVREELVASNAQQGTKKIPGLGFKNLSNIVAERWKTIDLSVKEVLQQQAKRNLELYYVQVEAWERQVFGNSSQSQSRTALSTSIEALQKHQLQKASPQGMKKDNSEVLEPLPLHSEPQFHPEALEEFLSFDNREVKSCAGTITRTAAPKPSAKQGNKADRVPSGDLVVNLDSSVAKCSDKSSHERPTFIKSPSPTSSREPIDHIDYDYPRFYDPDHSDPTHSSSGIFTG